MDYNYIRLEKQVKQLMNRNYVPSSAYSQTAEEIIKSPLRLYIDLTSKWFIFRYIGSSFDPLYIDPLNRAIMNVQFLNNVNISKLVGGLVEGYGIIIDNMGEGVYKINVKQEMFALKADLDAVNDRFDDYTTTEDLAATYATNAKVEEIDAKFINYATNVKVEEIDAKFVDYATNAKVEEIDAKFIDYATNAELDAKFDDYTTTTDLEANYVKKDDVIPPSETQFELVPGFQYYALKHSDITNYSPDNTYTQYNVIKIDVKNETLMNQIKATTTKIDIFKVNLRKQLLIDFYGNILNDFIVSYNPETSKFVVPRISYYDVNDSHKVDYIDRDEIEVWFDKELSFHPYTEYLNGELVIEYLLSQDALASKEPVLRCDIIDARNALKLRESDIYYFYRPSMILFDSDVKYMEDTEWSCECYKMIFKIPTTYTIPMNLDFSFKEYCFGNSWALKWDGNKWCGDNIQGRINPKIIRKCNMRTQKDAYGATGCFCMVKRDTWNRQHIPANENGLAFSLFENSTKETIIQFKDGTTEKGSVYNLAITYSGVLRGAEYKGYDLVPVGALYNNYSETQINIDNIDALYLDLTLPGQSTTNRLSFIVEKVHHDDTYNRGILDIIGSLDTVEAISGVWSKRSTDIDNTRDIVLYLNKTYTQAIDEVNWDPTTNAFTYIIQQQYYEVSPNPNAATTLYTDYNITSSKIITADNITTMRSDLNMVTNTVDVVSYDVKEIRNKVDTLDTEMTETKKVTQHLQEDIDNVRMISNVALAFGVIGTVGSIGSIGMQLASNGISFATKAGTAMIQNCAAEGMEHEMAVETITIMQAISALSLRSIQTDITPVLDWCNEEYKALPEIAYEDETDNPRTKACSVFTALDICNRFRDTLKQPIKLLVTRINEISDMQNYIGRDELTREDTVDIFPKVENSNLILELEDTVISGLIVFKIFVKAASTTNNWQRRLYIKIVNGEITAYKGVQDADTTIDGITIKLLARSEDDRVAYMPTATISNKLISIPINPDYNVSGAVIETNTCTRQMVYEPKDFAYIQDIQALNKKIDTLAEQSHNNDVQTLSLGNQEYATIDEVNTALTNYVQKQDLPPTVDLTEYAKTQDLQSYRKKDDLTYNTYRDLTITQGENSFYYVEYVEGMHIKASLNYTEKTVNFDFNYHPTSFDETYGYSQDVIVGGETYTWEYNPSDNNLSVCDSLGNYLDDVIQFEYIRVEANTELALKSQIEELKAENAGLKAQIANLTLKQYPFLSYYTGFEEVKFYNETTDISKCVFYRYVSSSRAFTIIYDFPNHNYSRGYLCVLICDTGMTTITQFFRIDVISAKVHINEINSPDTEPVIGYSTYATINNINLPITNTDPSKHFSFSYVFQKV